MRLRTIEELNRAFIIENTMNVRNTKYEPITPIVIDLEPPKTIKTTVTGKNKLKYLQLFKNRSASTRTNKGNRLFSAISDMLFSLSIVMILFVVLVPNANGGTPKRILKYTYFTVVSQSMQDEIPQGSLILVKHIDPSKLEPGDNITFMVDHNMTVTHKIVGIYENYDNSGARGFQTKGVNNLNPDRDIVYEANLVGKVILVLPALGVALSYLSENVFLVFIIFSLSVLLSFLLRGVFGNPAKKTPR